MATGSVMTNEGLNGVLDRISKFSPDVSAFDRIIVGTNGTTPQFTDDINSFTPSVGFPKSILVGYPTFDSTNIRMTLRGFVSSIEANGDNLQEVGIVNSDGPDKTLNRDVHNVIVKDDTQEISYVQTFTMVR